MADLKAALAEALEGDLSRFSAVLAAHHTELQTSATKLSQLLVSPSAVVRVLTDWRGGDRSAEEVRQWASFVRRGYVSGSDGLIQPLDIYYQPGDEDLMVEVIARLDEIEI